MCHLGTGFSGGVGCAGVMIGLNALKDLCDSVIPPWGNAAYYTSQRSKISKFTCWTCILLWTVPVLFQSAFQGKVLHGVWGVAKISKNNKWHQEPDKKTVFLIYATFLERTYTWSAKVGKWCLFIRLPLHCKWQIFTFLGASYNAQCRVSQWSQVTCGVSLGLVWAHLVLEI